MSEAQNPDCRLRSPRRFWLTVQRLSGREFWITRSFNRLNKWKAPPFNRVQPDDAYRSPPPATQECCDGDHSGQMFNVDRSNPGKTGGFRAWIGWTKPPVTGVSKAFDPPAIGTSGPTPRCRGSATAQRTMNRSGGAYFLSGWATEESTDPGPGALQECPCLPGPAADGVLHPPGMGGLAGVAR